jgi:60 kDa SS-A/Ro ribonucleoprotein
LVVLNRRQAKGELVIYVSDNESWVDAPQYGRFGGSRTQTMEQWAIFQRRNPGAKMVCIDLVPNQTTQASERADILNIGGFSDQVFEVISQFAEGTLAAEHWVGVIETLRI